MGKSGQFRDLYYRLFQAPRSLSPAISGLASRFSAQPFKAFPAQRISSHPVKHALDICRMRADDMCLRQIGRRDERY
jgi:hypothetical protein